MLVDNKWFIPRITFGLGTAANKPLRYDSTERHAARPRPRPPGEHQWPHMTAGKSVT